MARGTLGRLLRDVRRLVTGPARPVYVEYARTAGSRLAGRPVRITAVTRLTSSAVSLRLEDTSGAPIDFVAGQFLTLRVSIDGVEYRRAYSLCSSRLELPAVRIGVKEVPGGRVSEYLCRRARVGDVLDVFGPSGSFTVDTDPLAERRYVLIAGGSGITPLLAIVRAVLESEPRSSVALLYGNRSLADTMFRDELDELRGSAPERLVVRHVVETGEPGAHGRAGRLGGDVLAAELDAVGPTADAWYFVCGPEPMMDDARCVLVGRGVSADRIRVERFTPAARAAPHPDVRTRHTVTVRQGERLQRFDVAADVSLLEAGRAAGVSLPFSCTVGGCGSCRVRLLAGDVDMDEPNCLTADERAAGWALTCVARVRSAVEIEIEHGRTSTLTTEGERP